jgi:hypothetical protein
LRNEDLDLRFCEKIHESLKSKNVVGSLSIFFPNCENEVMFKNIINFKERNAV